MDKNKLKGDELKFIEPEIEEIDIPEQKEFYELPVRFGAIPLDEAPLGWEVETRRKQPKITKFEYAFPKIRLPFQEVFREDFGHSDEFEKNPLFPTGSNRLFFGDNLYVMRQLPSKSIDLIYIAPPFFSGRNYNVLFGDKNEIRSFSDIWEGGMPGYLIWLNVRLYEMKRLLKPDGSIYVHLDWHASHYVKVEMDKIFGHRNFRNEIVWCYRGMPSKAKKWQQKHDSILFYTKSDQAEFNVIRDKPTGGSLRTFESGKKKGYNVNLSKKMATIFDWEKYNEAVISKALPSDLNPVEFSGGAPPMSDWWTDIKILGGPKNKERSRISNSKTRSFVRKNY